MDARTALRAARSERGWSLRDLARRCGVAQPSLSDIESGERDTTVDKLEQILRPTGFRLVAVPSTRPTVAEWSMVLRDVIAHDPGGLEKCLVQISDDLWATDGPTCVATTITPPPPTGERSVDAAVAALVEHHLAQRSLPIPAWVHDDGRTSGEPWDLIQVKGLQALARAATPEPFSRRNVYLPADLFESV